MVLGIAMKTKSRFFLRSDFTNTVLTRECLSFSAAVFMSLVGLGVSVFSTNQLLASSSTKPMLLPKSK